MRGPILLAVVAAALGAGPAGSAAAAPGDAALAFAPTSRLSEALDRLAELNGVSRDRFRVDPAALDLEMTYGGRFRLQNYVMREPLRAPGTLQTLARELCRGTETVPRLDLLADLARTEGRGVSSEAAGGENAQPAPEGIAEAMEALYAGTGKRFQGNDRDRVLREAGTLPEDVLRPVIALLAGIVTASHTRDEVVKESEFRQGGAFDFRSKRTARNLRGFLSGWGDTASVGDRRGQDLAEALDSVDLDAVLHGGERLAAVVDSAAAACETPGFGTGAPAEFQYMWDTPMGRIAVGGAGANTYAGSFALVVDLGGDDVYRGPGSASGTEPVSVVLDLGGNDRYAPADSGMAGPGGALLGYAAVTDLGAGRDEYDADGWGCGFGFLGVGWVRDDGGDDLYRARWLSEGAGFHGLGLLLDEAGNDRYVTRADSSALPAGNSQGFGGPSGLGALVDLAGDDRYGEPAGPDGANGVGTYLQGASLGVGSHRAGGLGMLVDQDGRDTYTAGDRSQGVSCGAGLGVLVDLAGDDAYTAGGDAQGAGLDSGAGLLLDVAGNDTHALARSGLGLGVNLGMGMLVDLAGDDAYGSTYAVGGVAREHGAGWFLDLAGTDDYTKTMVASTLTMGVITPATRRPWLSQVPAVAVFVDMDQRILGIPSAPFHGWNLSRVRGPGLGGIVGGPAASTDSKETQP